MPFFYLDRWVPEEQKGEENSNLNISAEVNLSQHFSSKFIVVGKNKLKNIEFLIIIKYSKQGI